MVVIDKSQKSFLKKYMPLAALIGGLCCFTPVVLVLLGLSSVAYAASLSDLLYGSYKWVFRGSALLFLLLGLFWYFYKKENICTIDKLKRERRKIINFVLITLIFAVLMYIIWLYVIVEIIGLLLGIWG
ncbi:hypothetical protein CL617_05495 [archaeon]|nr:hypothetical protein [archaeon]|tara:strand:- start:843 stop:1229 length:387 start_codon:yes stop_codon:yes gene_type:complete